MNEKALKQKKIYSSINLTQIFSEKKIYRMETFSIVPEKSQLNNNFDVAFSAECFG